MRNELISTKQAKQSQHTLELLQAIEAHNNISQRDLAQEMGVALGLANGYLKRCVRKGWIKITTAPANRYLYYLTPNGFAEKARLTADFLTTSLALFRQSGEAYSGLFETIVKRGGTRVVLIGLSDLTEIAYMRALASPVEVVAVYQPTSVRQDFFGLVVSEKLEQLPEFDFAVVTAMEQSHELVAQLSTFFSNEKILIPSMLLNMHYRNVDTINQ